MMGWREIMAKQEHPKRKDPRAERVECWKCATCGQVYTAAITLEGENAN